MGGAHSLALKSDGTVVGWGYNANGERTVPAGLTGVIAIKGGGNHSLALKSNGTVVAWGDNLRGQRNVPAGLTDVTAIATGFYHSLALKSNGTVVAWGENFDGQSTVPAGLTGVTAIAGGDFHSLAVKSDGTVVAWGHDQEGQSTVPAELTGVIAVAAGESHSLALQSDGTVTAWGYNGYGQNNVPVGLTGVTALSAGNFHTLVVSPANAPPEADVDKTVTVAEDANPTSLDIAAPTDPDSDPLTVTVLAVPNAGLGTVRYTDDSVVALNDAFSVAELIGLQFHVVANANGTAGTFQYRVEDGQGGSASQTITLEITAVNDAPVAVNNGYSVDEDDVLQPAAPGVLGNDTDVEGDSLTAELGQNPSHGTLNLNSNGSFTYQPSLNYHGPDSFTYRSKDPSGDYSGFVTVTLTVNPVNDPPVAANNSYSVDEDTLLTISAPGVLGNDTDLDGDSLTAELGLSVSHGTLNLASDGSFTYQGNLHYNGPDSFTYRAKDPSGVYSGFATVNLTVNPVNDAPVAVNNNYSVDEDTLLSQSAPGVLGNDTDVEDDTLTAELGQDVSHGTLNLSSNGSFTYQANLNYNGPDSFTYRAKDPSGAYSGFATVNLTVNPVNDMPVAQDNRYTTSRGTKLEVPAPGVLQNDSDVEGGPLSAVLQRLPNEGTLTLRTDGSFCYTPRVGFTGTDTFTYRASDRSLESRDATVSIVVSPDPPVPDTNVQASGSGTIAVTGGQASFTFDVRRTNGIIQGALTYVDPVRTRSLTSTKLTSLVGTGQTMRIHGIGKLSNGSLVDFVVDLADLAEPGRLKDTFRIELGSGPVVSGVLTTGNLRVNR